MPELPEVETTRRGIEPHLGNGTVSQLIVRNGRLRWPVDPDLPTLLAGKKIRTLSRRGKYLIFQFSHGALLWHLGMSGSIRVLTENAEPQKHDHIDLCLSNGKRLRYNDPRRFGAAVWTTEPVDTHPLIQHLGPEPLSEDFNSDYLFQQSRKKNQAVKSWIMDSKVVVGVGNIYANESLFLAGIRPTKAAGKLTKKKIEDLTVHIKDVLSKAIKQGGTTLRDFVGSDGKPGYFKQQLFVYGRGGQPCKQCDAILKEKVIAQRATTYCTQCQK